MGNKHASGPYEQALQQALGLDGVCLLSEQGADQEEQLHVVLETAQPIKFGETIREALEREPERPAAFIGIEELPQKFDIVAADAALVKAYIAERI